MDICLILTNMTAIQPSIDYLAVQLGQLFFHADKPLCWKVTVDDIKLDKAVVEDDGLNGG